MPASRRSAAALRSPCAALTLALAYVSCGEVVDATTIRPKSIAHLQHARRVIQFASLIKQFAEQRARQARSV